MAKVRESDLLLPSVLDRLIDDDSNVSMTGKVSAVQQLRQLKQNVKRDLENLLNTRWRVSSWPPELTELDVSLINYGVPDFSGVNMSQASSREELREIIETVIRRFEPRLKKVEVRMLDAELEGDRTLHFQIDGLLQAEPSPEPVTFSTDVEPATAVVTVKPGRE